MHPEPALEQIRRMCDHKPNKNLIYFQLPAGIYVGVFRCFKQETTVNKRLTHKTKTQSNHDCSDQSLSVNSIIADQIWIGVTKIAAHCWTGLSCVFSWVSSDVNSEYILLTF